MVVLAVGGFTAFFVTLSSLPAWLASHGASTVSAGAATTAMLAATVACEPIVPLLLRRVSTTWTVAIGLLLLSLPTPLLLWASAGAGLYGVCAVRGVGFAIFAVAGTFMVSEVAPPGRQGEVAGLYGLAAALPKVIMVPLAVLLLRTVGFWPIAILAAVPALGATAALGHDRRRAPLPVRGPDTTAGTRAAIAGALAPSGVLCTTTIAGGAIVTILPIELAGNVATIALFVFGVSGAVARWRAGVLVDRHGIMWLLLGACAATIVGMVALAAGLADGQNLVILPACAVAGAGYGAVQCLTLVAAFARTGGHARTVASAMWNAAFDAGTAVGAILIGVLTATSLGLWGAGAALAALVAATLPAAVTSGRAADRDRSSVSSPA